MSGLNPSTKRTICAMILAGSFCLVKKSSRRIARPPQRRHRRLVSFRACDERGTHRRVEDLVLVEAARLQLVDMLLRHTRGVGTYAHDERVERAFHDKPLDDLAADAGRQLAARPQK